MKCGTDPLDGSSSIEGVWSVDYGVIEPPSGVIA